MSNVTPVLAPFHLALPVRGTAAARAFYGGILGCPEGRSSPDQMDFNFYGHQVVTHPALDEIGHHKTSAIDSDNVPMRHFDVVLSISEWGAAADRLCVAGIKSIIEPHIRLKGEVDEQAAMFFLNPSGNAMGTKTLVNMVSLFAK